MENKIPHLLVLAGPLEGRRFTLETTDSLRLGRSSSCEIAISDPALSRNHCLIEAREGALWITDLASANGTRVNDALLGAQSQMLKSGDVIQAGETRLRVVGDEKDAPAPDAPEIDLGLAKQDEDAQAHTRKNPGRSVLWGLAGAVVLVAAAMILFAPVAPQAPKAVSSIQNAQDDTLLSVTFERVDAHAQAIYRYALTYGSDGTLDVSFADVPKENRYFSRTVKLSAGARKRLAAIFAGEALYALDEAYMASGAQGGVLKSRYLKVVKGGRVFETRVENAPEPEALRDVCEQLEAFSKNELGAWALQYSAEKLQKMSADAVRTADAKWEERDVQYGNLAAAIKAYDEAIVYLDTVNPKPPSYEKILEKRKRTRDELDKRYRDQRFLVDRAVNMGDWPTARRELRILCDMVPDARDPRHAEAAAKLMDVEARQKKEAQQ